MKPLKLYFMKITEISNNDLMKEVGSKHEADKEVKELLRRFASAIATIDAPHLYDAERHWDEDEKIWIITPKKK